MDDSWDDLEVDLKSHKHSRNVKTKSSNPFLPNDNKLASPCHTKKEDESFDDTNNLNNKYGGNNVTLSGHENSKVEEINVQDIFRVQDNQVEQNQTNAIDNMDYIGTTYGSVERPTRIFGQNFKYMKHYVRERSNSLTKLSDQAMADGELRNMSPSSAQHYRNLSNLQIEVKDNTIRKSTLQRQHSCNTSSENQPKIQVLQRQSSLDSSSCTYDNEDFMDTKNSNIQYIQDINWTPYVPTMRREGNSNAMKSRHLASHASKTNLQAPLRKYYSDQHLDRHPQIITNEGEQRKESKPRDYPKYRGNECINASEVEDDTNPFQNKYVTLSNHRLMKLKEANSLALKRKDDLQRELLYALKKITKLEVNESHLSSEKRELMIELRIIKQRLGEAERDAANSIGRTAKLEQDLSESDRNVRRCQDELHIYKNKIQTLEDQLCESKANILFECDRKTNTDDKILKIENERKASKDEILKLENSLILKTEEIERLCATIKNISSEKNKYLKEIECFKEEKLKMVESTKKTVEENRYCENTINQLKDNLKEQKLKFDIIIKSRINLENELNNMHNELAKEKIEKKRILIDHHSLQKEVHASQNLLMESKEKIDTLNYEIKELRDQLKQLRAHEARQHFSYGSKLPQNTSELKDYHLQQQQQQQPKFDVRNLKINSNDKSSIINDRRRKNKVNQNPQTISRKPHVHAELSTPVQDIKSSVDENAEINANRARGNATKKEISEKAGRNLLLNRHEKIAWNRSAYDMNKIKNEIYYDSSNPEDGFSNGNSMLESNSDNNMSYVKTAGVKFANSLPADEPVVTNFSDLLHEDDHDLANAFM